jgi:hypothetical protein
MMRAGLASTSGVGGLSPEGKTVGQVIDEQRSWITVQDEKERKEKEKARSAALRNELPLSVVQMTLVTRGFMESFDLKCAFTNQTGQDILAFEGNLEFKDLLGNRLGEDPIEVSTIIRSGGSGSFNESFPSLMVTGLEGKKLSDLNIVWTPTKILFVDGATYPSQFN